MKLKKQFDFQIANLTKFAMAMTWSVENIENVEDCNFPIIHYALKSASGTNKSKQAFLARSIPECILGFTQGPFQNDTLFLFFKNGILEYF